MCDSVASNSTEAAVDAVMEYVVKKLVDVSIVGVVVVGIVAVVGIVGVVKEVCWRREVVKRSCNGWAFWRPGGLKKKQYNTANICTVVQNESKPRNIILVISFYYSFYILLCLKTLKSL